MITFNVGREPGPSSLEPPAQAKVHHTDQARSTVPLPSAADLLVKESTDKPLPQDTRSPNVLPIRLGNSILSGWIW